MPAAAHAPPFARGAQGEAPARGASAGSKKPSRIIRDAIMDGGPGAECDSYLFRN